MSRIHHVSIITENLFISRALTRRPGHRVYFLLSLLAFYEGESNTCVLQQYRNVAPAALLVWREFIFYHNAAPDSASI